MIEITVFNSKRVVEIQITTTKRAKKDSILLPL